jgi:uncharacterized membrane protein YkoI
MKKLFLVFIAASLISAIACAQNAKKIPAKVKSAFEQKFPMAQKVKWGQENATEWEAEFTLNNIKYSANFNVKGNWLETEYKIGENEIPAIVIKTLGKEFPGYKIEASEISETAKGKIYEFEIKTSKTKTEVGVNADGTLVKKEKGSGKD